MQWFWAAQLLVESSLNLAFAGYVYFVSVQRERSVILKRERRFWNVNALQREHSVILILWCFQISLRKLPRQQASACTHANQ